MDRIYWLLVCTIVVVSAHAQTSRSEKTGFWTSGSSWVGGTMPGALAGGTVTVTSQTVVINGRIETTQNINVNFSNLSVNAGDTLVILGNLTLNLSSLTNNGVLIVFGNVSNTGSNNTIGGAGKLVVTGNYSNAAGLNTFTGPSYIYGSTSGFIFPPGVEDESDLQTDDLALYDYTNAIYTALPVTLLYFSAQAGERNVEIKWATAAELNNDYFLVERSKDGINFSRLMFVDGAGTTPLKTSYNEVDLHPYIGRSYYRLTQVDYDGKTTIFNVVTVSTEESDQPDPYPNPTSSDLYFDVEPGNYLVSLSDLNGVMIPSAFMMTEIESGRLSLDLSSLESGVYIVYLVNKANSNRSCYRVIRK